MTLIARKYCQVFAISMSSRRPVCERIRHTNRSLVAVLLIISILTGVGGSSGVSAAGSALFTEVRYVYTPGTPGTSGSINCVAAVSNSGDAQNPFRIQAKCSMTDTRDDAQGIWISVRLYKVDHILGDFILTAPQCTNGSGVGTSVSCYTSFLSETSSVRAQISWGYTTSYAYYQVNRHGQVKIP